MIFTQIRLLNHPEGKVISTAAQVGSTSISTTRATNNSNDTHMAYWMLWDIGPRPSSLVVLSSSSVNNRDPMFVAAQHWLEQY